MVASWAQTIILAVIGALLPFSTALANGASVSLKVVLASVATAALAAVSNVLRSPVENPPTAIKAPDSK